MADKRNNSSRDIISGLPCELLSYIFGFLPLKEAARTSVISTKFRHIWRGIDRIDLQDFVPPFELNPEEFWTKNLIILSCIETSLKVVEVFGFQGTGNEVLMLQYLILFGSVLEEVNLYLSEEDDGYSSNRENYQ
ncbi:hypothetical protein LWI29_013281 [Acer saccharum]|uniref:F-box domain-containing protein n=1 Tax=Acer saccharum TaxID=4024 RepID=A0AA39T380_ACESA|nr:hypothetical protein LWI29_013281 [Acer saccharum]